MKILQPLLITLTSLVADASSEEFFDAIDYEIPSENSQTLKNNFANLMKKSAQHTIADLFVGKTMESDQYNPIWNAFVNTDNLDRKVENGEKVRIPGKESMTRTYKIQEHHINETDNILVTAISTDKNNETTKIEIVENHQVEFDMDGDAWSIFTAVLNMNGLFPQTIDYLEERYFFQGISGESRWDDIFTFKYAQKRDDLLHKSIEVIVNAQNPTKLSKAYFSNNKSSRFFDPAAKTEITESLKLLYPVAIAGSNILRGAYRFDTKSNKQLKTDAFMVKYFLKRNQKYYHIDQKVTVPMITIDQNPKTEDDANDILRNLIGDRKLFNFYMWSKEKGFNMKPYTQQSAGKIYAKFILRK